MDKQRRHTRATNKKPAMTSERSEVLDDLKAEDAQRRGELRSDSRRAAKRQNTPRKPS